MKMIAGVATGLLSIVLGSPARAAGEVSIYHGAAGDIGVVKDGGGYTVWMAGGAVPNGAATAGDCFVKSFVSLKKRPDYYEGDFIAVHNEIVGLNQSEMDGKGIGLLLDSDKVQVTGAETDGLCADGVDFAGEYSAVLKPSDRYRDSFLYLMNLEHQDSVYKLNKQKDAKGAVDDLRPFVESYQSSWLDDASSRKVIVPALNDYAYALQLTGFDSAAIEVLQTVIQASPGRTAAWLNIADSYWNGKNFDSGKRNYAQYVKLMEADGLKARIPSRVFERLGNQTIP